MDSGTSHHLQEGCCFSEDRKRIAILLRVFSTPPQVDGLVFLDGEYVVRS